ncbi:hypothetical protein SUGI_0835830 [Cryptomeria japonica]|uniref:putative pentatricopeptide repeat-containing protein At3g13770, mitochondrial n=1 Tax=Cryptomeria japonica TaxID=3369 RepID=UPI002414B895|nr:putative pentatricopeptide repeat-containing protein At3g13770, mitochondrial [Cryptomeria japonica]GLJ40523.1 hypothetical protein SUGI_0835830 [Cryptomeria japonica]
MSRLKTAVGMIRQSARDDSRTEWRMYGSLMQWCVDTKSMAEGHRIRVHMIKQGFKPDVYLETKFLILHVKCRRVAEARQLFDRMSERNVVSWNTMISGYAEQGDAVEALAIFVQMQRYQNPKPDPFTFATILKVCALEEPESEEKHTHRHIHIQQLHAQVIRRLFKPDVVLLSTLIDAYAKSGCMDYASKVFDEMPQRSVVSWTAMIGGYVKSGRLDEALECFWAMPERDVVAWNAMMEGYAEEGEGEKALGLYVSMQRAGFPPSHSTFPSIVKACSHLAALDQAHQLHAHLIKHVGDLPVQLGSALVDMYAKCGCVESARRVFEAMPADERNVICWTTMIDAYGRHGRGVEATQVFDEMQRAGRAPNDVTFLSLLNACSHAGLVHEGSRFFLSIPCLHSLTPHQHHYACMVDLLGRAGQLEATFNFILKMPVPAGPHIWAALLAACRVHHNLRLANLAAQRLFSSNDMKPGRYVVLSNIYASAGMWYDASNVRRVMKERGVSKEPGCSWIDVDKQVHAFHVEDRSHPQTQEIYAMLERLSAQLSEAGYVPHTNSVLYDVDEEEKHHILRHHSEKLAIAFGLIRTPATRHICIMKNLRICVDCHNAINFISKMVPREIVVRDINRFHYFKNGVCSCGNSW